MDKNEQHLKSRPNKAHSNPLTPKHSWCQNRVSRQESSKTVKKTGILVSYFAKRDEAREAFGKLLRKNHRRAAWVTKNAAGKVQIGDPFRLRRFWGAVVAIIIFGTLAEAVSMRLAWPMFIHFSGKTDSGSCGWIHRISDQRSLDEAIEVWRRASIA